MADLAHQGVPPVQNAPVLNQRPGESPGGEQNQNGPVWVLLLVEYGPADGFSGVLLGQRRAGTEDAPEIIANWNVRPPVGRVDAVFQRQMVIVHDAGGGQADAIQLLPVDPGPGQQRQGAVLDDAERLLGRVRDDPGQMGAVYLVHAHVEQRQAQVLRPHADSQQVLPAGKAEVLRLLPPQLRGIPFAGAGQNPLSAKKLDGLHHRQFADASAGHHVRHRVGPVVPEAGEHHFSVLYL